MRFRIYDVMGGFTAKLRLGGNAGMRCILNYGIERRIDMGDRMAAAVATNFIGSAWFRQNGNVLNRAEFKK